MAGLGIVAKAAVVAGDWTGADQQDVDPFVRQFQPQLLRIGRQSEFGRRVAPRNRAADFAAREPMLTMWPRLSIRYRPLLACSGRPIKSSLPTRLESLPATSPAPRRASSGRRC